MSETITLPRSGVAMEPMREPFENDFRVILGGLSLRIYRDFHVRWGVSTLGGGYAYYLTQREAIESADSMVLALRAALLPPDARDVVARVLHDYECGDGVPRWDVLIADIAGDPCSRSAKYVLDKVVDAYRTKADAVLSALRGGR